MASLDVTFEVPARIAKGLANQTLIRNGGVIQDQAGHVVMWLKEATPAGHEIAGAIQGSIPFITAGSSILTLGVSVLGFALIYKKVKALESQLQEVQEVLDKIDEKIDLSFYANFRAALDLAQNAFSMEEEANRRSSALQAVNRFLEAEHVYTELTDKELASRSQIGDEYLLTLCLAYLAETRCYLELGEYNTALRRFQEGKEKIRERIEKYIDVLLTDNPSMYLHPKLKGSIDLARLTRIYHWKDAGYDENDVFELVRDEILDLRSGFDQWAEALPPSIMAQDDIKRFFFSISEKGRQSIFDRLPLVVDEMESMIETNQRFASYEHEIKLLSRTKVPFSRWETMRPSQALPEDASIICITPPQPLAL